MTTPHPGAGRLGMPLTHGRPRKRFPALIPSHNNRLRYPPEVLALPAGTAAHTVGAKVSAPFCLAARSNFHNLRRRGSSARPVRRATCPGPPLAPEFSRGGGWSNNIALPWQSVLHEPRIFSHAPGPRTTSFIEPGARTC